MTKISVEDALKHIDLGEAFLIDVRSEKEFEEDHLPSAINIPILNNEERHIVGYTYKQESQDKAYVLGYKIFDEKIKDFEKILEGVDDKKIIFYCFRGGTRSGCFVEYFSKKGREVFQIEGGYKKYREHVRNELEKAVLPKKIIVLYGLTGCGKTEIINRISHSIDLEGLANHKSSLFGGVGLKPNSQKMFESMLFYELKKKREYLVLEGESRKIGSVIIPLSIFEAMNNSIKVEVNCNIDIRSKRIVKDYFANETNIDEIKNIIPKLTERLGKKNINELLILLNEKKYFEFSKKLLLEYYDPLYSHGIKDFKFDKKFDSDDIDDVTYEIEKFCKLVSKD